ncbi:MAG: DUF58 domain-containing protein [Defluviitaleaceae bacterium]|nr:DUF58 domain-containing protein [Defluviitaleaceae bacterium]
MLVVIVVLILLAAVVQRITLAYALKGVTYKAYASQQLVEPNQAFTIYSEIENPKALPELFMELREPVPWEAKIIGNINITGDKRYTTKRFYIMPRQRVISKMELSLPARGNYRLPLAYMYGGDFLGVKSKSKTFPFLKGIIVMPNRLESPQVTKALGGFLGDVSVRRFIMPDPVLTVGTRDYTGREPLRDIHHAHTARQNRLMVRQYDYTLEPAVTVMLNTAISPVPPRYHKVENSLCLARTVFEELDNAGAKFSFITNAKSSYTERWNNVPDGLGPGHMNELLGGLGCASYATTRETYGDMIENAILKCEQGRSHIILTPEDDELVHPQLIRLREASGGQVLVITPDGIVEF